MNNQLIPVFSGQLNNQTINLVDAKILHSFLEVGRAFNAWISNRIKMYGFIENQDFTMSPVSSIVEPVQNGTGYTMQATAKRDYHLTLDMAKELAMVERNDKGREARRYFINCEKQLNKKQLPNPKYTPITENQQINLRNAVQKRANQSNVTPHLIYQELYETFAVTKYADIPERKFTSAMMLVKMLNIESTKKQSVKISQEQRNEINSLMNYVIIQLTKGTNAYNTAIQLRHTLLGNNELWNTPQKGYINIIELKKENEESHLEDGKIKSQKDFIGWDIEFTKRQGWHDISKLESFIFQYIEKTQEYMENNEINIDTDNIKKALGILSELNKNYRNNLHSAFEKLIGISRQYPKEKNALNQIKTEMAKSIELKI